MHKKRGLKYKLISFLKNNNKKWYYRPLPVDEGAGDLFCFAGLYSQLDNATFSTTIITTQTNPFFAEIHNKKKRITLVLDESLYSAWLDPSLKEGNLKDLMHKGFTTKDFTAHEVSRDLYRKKSIQQAFYR